MKKHWILYLFIVMLLLPGGCGSSSATKQSYQQSRVIIRETSADWGQLIVNGKYVLINNVWNKGAASGKYSQRIFEETIDGKPAIGWQWQWPAATNVVAYPEVVYGDKPWDTPAKLVSELPIEAGSITDLTVNYAIKLNASGIYNMAFSIWAITNPSDPINSITHEIMIWIVNQDMTPAGSKQGSLKVNGVSFDVYKNTNHGDNSGSTSNTWTYIAFVAREPIFKGPLDIKEFITYLLGNSYDLTGANYITSVELGNEIVQGSGIAEISDYSITIE